MPEYLAPGVYVEEVDTGPRPIEGVSTSTAGFVGETERGPARPRLITSWQDYQRWYGTYIDQLPLNATNCYLPYAVRGFFENGGQRVFVARAIGKTAVPAQADLPGAAGATTVRAIGKGVWGKNIRILVMQASAAQSALQNSPVASWFRIQVIYYSTGVTATMVDPTDGKLLANANRQEPTVFEDFDNLSGDHTQTNFATTVINGASTLIEVVTCPGAPTQPVKWPGVALDGGTYVAAAEDDYIDPDTTETEAKVGLAALNSIREISLVAIPDEVVLNTLADKLQDACDIMRDRFAIHSDLTLNGSPDPSALRPLRDTSYGALYYPWLRVVVSHTPDGTKLVPSTGHVTGIFARTDVDRGVHKAPANEVVMGILGRDLNGNRKPLSQTLNKREHDVLNPRGVNVIRDFRSDGRDIRVWGARTMTSDAMWKYINVRRLFIFIEQSIDRGTQWVVFEPNSEPTWIALRTSISNFLRTVWRNGALMGTTPEEAFFVKCDRTTMSQDDFDNGRLICLIGIAPVKPAEFVIFRISQKTVDAQS